MPLISSANSVIVFDFETTGLSTNQGDRAIEIGAIKLKNGIVVDHFQSLMNPGFRISRFIEDFTGISNIELQKAPNSKTVMNQFADFIQGSNLVAHNASFDQRFLDAELANIHRDYKGEITCSLLISRRLTQDAPSHKLSELVRYHKIKNEGVFHRALADAQVTASLWLILLRSLQHNYNISDPDFALMKKIAKTPKTGIAKLLKKYS